MAQAPILDEREYSVKEWLAHHPQERDEFFASLSDDEIALLEHSWEFRARPKQLAPEGDWRIWLICAGRGFGKTDAIVQWAYAQAKNMPGSRGAIVATTAADARDTLVEGESGFLAHPPHDFMPKYEPTKRRLTFPNGSRATLFSADEPRALRGPQHHWAICDELAAWMYPSAWDMLLFGLRLGSDPRVAIATTPRPIPIIRNLVKDPTCKVVYGSTYENRANLAPAFFNEIITRYEGSRLGQQELMGIVLDDEIAGLWTQARINSTRVEDDAVPDLVKKIISIDPAVTAHAGSNETGIIVAGKSANGHAYILKDLSLRGRPEDWADVVVTEFDEGLIDHIVVEVNNGGDLVESTLHARRSSLPVVQVRASKGKIARAEPVSVLYEQNRVHHAGKGGKGGVFEELEKQMIDLVQGTEGKDRVDALVWAIHDLILGDQEDAHTPMRTGVARFKSDTRWGGSNRESWGNGRSRW